LSPLHFEVASFFIRGLSFEPSFVALAFLVYQLLSNTELVLLAISTMVIAFLWNEAYIITLGLHGLYVVKNLTPSLASPVRKRVQVLRK
jgi:hypothetical protein